MMKKLHDAIIKGLTRHLPKQTTVEQYPRFARKVTLPGVFIELVEVSPADNRGTGQLDLTARFAAHVVFDQTTPAAELEAWSLAVSCALAIHEQGRFGQPVGEAHIVHVGLEQFKPELLGFVARTVEWSHDFRVGSSVWESGGILPTEVYLGYAPEIGPGHEPDYHPVEGLPDV